MNDINYFYLSDMERHFQGLIIVVTERRNFKEKWRSEITSIVLYELLFYNVITYNAIIRNLHT